MCDPNLYPNPNACIVFSGIKVRPEFLVELDPIHNVTSFEYLPLVRSLLLKIYHPKYLCDYIYISYVHQAEGSHKNIYYMAI